jgi:hypothetical protein
MTAGDDLTWAWKELVVACLRYDTKICLTGLVEVEKIRVKLAGLQVRI